jgi:tRNA 2-thiocytidine biosynthesis protein TtcA
LRRILSLTRRCVEDYSMISPGDKIAVGVSGGKDSLSLLCAMARLQKFFPTPFEIVAISLDMGAGADFSGIVSLCRDLGVEYHVVPTNIKQVVFDIRKEPNPCSLCANLRRGALNAAAKRFGCNKIALGHHLDDAIETFFISLFYEGRINCFSPVTYLDRTDLTKIRPMLYVYEREIISFARRADLPVLSSGCPADGSTTRSRIKQFIEGLALDKKDIKKQVFSAIQKSYIKGWQKNTAERRRKSGVELQIP